jgi:uroporphyrinogen decarboxylase
MSTTVPKPAKKLATSGRARFVNALAQRRVDRPPVWFMRQAGRHLPGYRELRQKHSFLDLCRHESVCVPATIEPLHRYGVDAVIVFNDILIPLIDMGMELDFVPGPRFESLISTPSDAAALVTPAYDGETDVCRCLSAIRRQIAQSAGMIGFIGAPFTVAAFAIAGVGGQRGDLADSVIDKGETFASLQDRLSGVLADYASAQAAAGADAIQIFESLADSLSEDEYRRVGLPWLVEAVQRVRETLAGTPVIVFGRGLWPFAGDLAAAGATALSLDHSRPLGSVRAALADSGLRPSLQGNLDPETLRLPPREAAARAHDMLSHWRDIVPKPALARELGPTGWVFNLGHGVPADANPDSVLAVARAVREFCFEEAPR